MFVSHTQAGIERAAAYCEALSRTFDVVVANPPYMGSSSFNPFMNKWMKTNYPDFKSDLFAAFISRIGKLCAAHGEAGIMSPFVWMFISSYEKLRNMMIDEKALTSLVQLEYSGFSGATVPICTFTFHNSHVDGYLGGYVRLSNFVGATAQGPKTLEAIQNPNCGWFYRADASTFHDIPGSPIAYWASEGLRDAFKSGRSLEEFAKPRQGLATGDNGRFLREWWETHKSSPIAWTPCTKGGGFRRWYGDAEWVVNWSENGKTLTSFPGSVIRNPEWYFKEGSTWGMISSSRISMRYLSDRYVFTNAGLASIGDSHSKNLLVLALMNSSVANYALQILAPTLNYSNGDLGRMAVIVPPDFTPVEELAEHCVRLSRADWDTQETSWDFKRNPLI